MAPRPIRETSRSPSLICLMVIAPSLFLRAGGYPAHPGRGDVHDRAAPPFAHPGQHGLDQRDRAEEVGGEHLLDLVPGCLLDGGAVAMAGVIDQDIDGAETLPGGADDVTDLGVVG